MGFVLVYNNMMANNYTAEQRARFWDSLPTRESRFDRLMHDFENLPNYRSRGQRYEWEVGENACFILGFWEGSTYVRDFTFGHNIITTHGRQYYAKRGAVETPAANEGATRFQLSNPTVQNPANLSDTWDQFDSAVAGNGAAGTGAAIANSNIAFTGGYPRTADPDSDNTGAGANVVSMQGFWAAGVATAASTFIKNFAIHDNSSPVNATKLVSHGLTTDPAGIQKNASDTLKGMLNHTVSSS